ncbi:MAG: hypothetical protein Fur0023_22040 [Bacteroidia bacterium]
MKKLLLIIGAVSAAFIQAQTTSFTLTYNFAQVSSTTTPCTGTLDPTTPPTATGLTSGSFIAVGTNSCPSTSGYFSFAGWGLGASNGNDTSFTGSIDLNKYYDITITPQTNYELSFDSIIFKALRSGTGPRFWAVRSNVNGYSANLTAISTNTNISVTGSNEFKWATDTYTTTSIQSGLKVMLGAPTFTQLTSSVSFRWYAWNAESTAGTFRIDDVNIYGSATLATGVAKITHNINAHFILSPNPATGNIVQLIPQNINEISFVEIVDALGNTIYKNNKVDVSKKIELNLDNIPAGMYFVRLGSAKNFYLEKLVINK